MKLLFIILSALVCNPGYAQAFTYPVITTTATSLSGFTPAGWRVLDSAFGDLNYDELTDAAFVLQTSDSVKLVKEEDTVVTQPRILVIVFKDTATNTYRLAKQSNSFILNHDNPAMDDPYQPMKINNHILQIHFLLFYNMGSWYVNDVSYKFRYQNNEFVLIGADNHSYHRATQDFEDYSYNFLTRKGTITRGDNSGNKKPQVQSFLINLKNLKTFETFIQPFTWEVIKDVYL